MDFGKRLAGSKRIAANRADTVRQIDEGQAAAIEESIIADFCNGIRKRDADQGIVAFESFRTDRGYVSAPDSRGDSQITARTGVCGEHDGAVFQKAIMEIPVDKIRSLPGRSIRGDAKKHQNQCQQQCRNFLHFL